MNGSGRGLTYDRSAISVSACGDRRYPLKALVRMGSLLSKIRTRCSPHTKHIRFSFHSEQEILLSTKIIQTSFEAFLASYTFGIGFISGG